MISVPKTEYDRLKKLEERFGDVLAYLGHLTDIREARQEIKEGKIIPQEEVFKRLGF
jgi:hypothetical protein